MKAIKVMWNGKPLRDIYPHATRWQVLKWKIARFTRKALIYSFIVGLVYGAFQLGATTNEVSYAKGENTVVEIPIKAAVMERIAQCESQKRQFNAQGKLLKNKNSNGTVDVGYYQINTVHFLTAMEMGYNLTEEKGNRAFAEEYLYPNFGTEPWYSTKSCWNK